MTGAGGASRIVRRVVRPTVAVAVLATVACGALGSPAHAGTELRADLVASGPTGVVVFNSGTRLFGKVRNDGHLRAPASQVTIRFQPVVRFAVPGGAVHYLNAFGSQPVVASTTVGALSPGAQVGFNAPSAATPSGLNRVTVCADSSALVPEQSEINNCQTEIKTVIPTYDG